ncbi:MULTISPECIES: isocitrate lyase/PEP mutase family protein [unclassified Rhizobium]|jgi:2-methylisocitrate lyase-like PEP mutase family enzyme|uniref:isocitrate lyase/PEP mutase family protein n=1 Tax=unclassified Rhizobium TaxID=2613769 RepID=UPI0008A7DF63|nr:MULTISPECIES: isocitrate lyase/PEP mutase family protein [unclassified Rhizobium]MBD8653430.1 isocitrate lyase/PEP mutase family protein [Rhizobium sp. CFBP 13726]SEH30443.1 2-Methylisocitrate lyase, PEP mutase family [Rhizobium sp. NFR12]
MSLSQDLKSGIPIVAPGVFDALTASIAAGAGFRAVYLSGAAIAYTHLGRPDIGLVSMAEVADRIAMICDRMTVPVIVDADTGYGNALNVQRTVRLFEKMGAQGIQLEDQTTPKRCGHLNDKSVVSTGEMVGKIKAAVDARANEQTLIIARTDALQMEGIDRALERAHLYAQAGADILFVEAPKSGEQLGDIAGALKGVRPLVANMVEGGTTPIHNAAELSDLGFQIVIFPGGIVRAMAKTAVDYYASLAAAGSNAPFADRMFDFNGLNALIGTPDMLALGRTYEDADGKDRHEEDAA